MPKGSSKDQRKAVGNKRALKRAKRSASKGKSAGKKVKKDAEEDDELDLNEENDESDAEDYKMHAFMPTPAQLQAEEQGASGVSLKKKHKRKREEKTMHTQTSFKRLKIPDFTDYPTFKKNFWLGVEDRGPHGDDLKMQRKSIAVLVKVYTVARLIFLNIYPTRLTSLHSLYVLYIHRTG